MLLQIGEMRHNAGCVVPPNVAKIRGNSARHASLRAHPRRPVAPALIAQLVELLERRLDNVVFRAGFARFIPAARQLARHGHVRVNGRTVDIPSFRVGLQHVVAIAEHAQRSQPVVEGLALFDQRRWDTSHLAVDRARFEVRLASLPDETAVPFPVDLQLVIELYALGS